MNRIPAVILAGGAARRMGGGDKPLMLHQGRPLLAHVIGALGGTGPVAINAGGDPARFASFGLSVIPDAIDGQLGPLAGILTAMEWASTDSVLVVAGDTVGLPHNLTTVLSPAPAYLRAGGRDHPTIGHWPTALAPALRSYIMAGNRRVMGWIEHIGAQAVETDAPIRNINRAEDLT